MLARIEGLVKELWNAPGQAKRDLPEYHRGLATAIVVLAPVAPHLAAELWRGFTASVERRLCPEAEGYLWDRPVFHQVREGGGGLLWKTFNVLRLSELASENKQ